MKMVKSLLLGTAAGLVAVAGAQAADMPVKAKPVQYVKICSLYGDGFYYVPGTDICLKLGGYVRAEYLYNAGSSQTNGPFSGVSAFKDRLDGEDFNMRTRAYMWMDTRQQTEYGTLRTYFQVGVNYDSPQSTTTTFSANRAFIQFAGFTVGTAQSFFDFYSSPASSYLGNFPNSDTGDGGWKVWAYTAQFGNGVSATVSIEEPRVLATTVPIAGVINTNLSTNLFVLGSVITPADRAKERFPAIVSNWRVDQAWGSAQVMFAAQDVSGAYYAATTANTCVGAATIPGTTTGLTGTLTGSEICGHPADKLGWAGGAGIKVNTFGGDYLQTQVTYSQGASRYVNNTPGQTQGMYAQFNGQSFGQGAFTDGVYSTATGDIQLTTAFGVNAAYDHFWRPDLRTSLYGFWTTYRYNAAANAAMCANQTIPTAGTAAFAPGATAGVLRGTSDISTCNNNWNWWGIGSRTQWNITPFFYVGFDVLYQKLETMSNGSLVTFTALANSAKPTAIYTLSNQDNWEMRIRIHRDIVP